jgi:prepilin-type N-terminal cleavage/methylation domain-containing protein
MSSRTLAIHHASIRRQGMTLVEMLIATTITLIIMAAVAEVFGLFGTGVTDSRSVIEMTDQMRAAAFRLRQDLAGVTAPTLPPLDPAQEQGYFEYIEGPGTDLSAAAGGLLDGTDTTALTADCDDILLFTSRSNGAPFVGRFETGTIESPVAEIGWFCKRAATQVAGGPTLYTLYRRQLLVTSYVGSGDFLPGSNEIAWPAGSWQAFYSAYDLSVRYDPASNTLKPNTLGDLTKPESRFLHNRIVGGVPAYGFPTVTGIVPASVPDASTGETLGAPRLGEDVVLTNILSFDVRAFDPNAELRTRSSRVDAVAPGDPGFADTTATTVARGAYVDLNWTGAPAASAFPVPVGSTFPGVGMPAFSGLGLQVVSGGTGNPLGRATYDTWSTHYESDGLDQDGRFGPDQGTNGFDDDGDGLIDEADEAETSPPYPVALRGIEVRIRCYEPSSRQIRQVTVRHTFVPH